jgi:hypothetical protein
MWSQARESWGGVDYLVRRVSGTDSGKRYRCPGCDHEVSAAVPHVVCWPDHDIDAEHRRHWHTPCWTARDRRSRARTPPRGPRRG